jgi:hypothetical protein
MFFVFHLKVTENRVMQWCRGWVRTTRVTSLSSRYYSRKAHEVRVRKNRIKGEREGDRSVEVASPTRQQLKRTICQLPSSSHNWFAIMGNYSCLFRVVNEFYLILVVDMTGCIHKLIFKSSIL